MGTNGTGKVAEIRDRGDGFVLSLEECWDQSKVGAGRTEEDWRSGILGQWQDRTLSPGSSQEASCV